ncbi:MAG: CDP-glycerol glycerophosphotransferase family protein [FCB group bacterium]|nr:CDP-glycerol glycerophosphotransferase family protein [FCB group bacterium]MBL7027238.1 CDP-glycerol glycerophosphotransferase family protein [Candidatus Neomarinimicrobiota bacterium]MBL7120527.1 CDP-glycerol glycerophosphotransferase family protein [Candidatus Neomarinimicrobiota bacterium]
MHSSQPQRLDFIYSAEKEKSALLPLYTHMKQHNSDVRMVKIHRRSIFKSYIRNLAPVVVASYDMTLDRVKKAGWVGRTVYVDHGLSPVKYYAYRYETFHDIDLLFYPGPVFKKIMEVLNPEFKQGLLGGLPKMDEFMGSKINKVDYCAELGLDPQKPVVLFAPTWGGKYESTWGINNARFLSGIPNLVISPHPADFKAAKRFNAILPKQPGSTNDLIKIADVVISDVSSIVGEAALLGKPTIQLELPNYPGCFPNPDKRKKGDWLDATRLSFFAEQADPIKRPFKLAFLDEDWVLGYTSKPENLIDTVERALSEPERFAEKRAYWNEQNCYMPDGNTNERLTKMIFHYIDTGVLKQFG